MDEIYSKVVFKVKNFKNVYYSLPIPTISPLAWLNDSFKLNRKRHLNLWCKLGRFLHRQSFIKNAHNIHPLYVSFKLNE